MINFPSNSVYKMTILGILALELFSFFAWLLPAFNTVAWFILVTLVFLVSILDLRFGVLILVAELMIGSFGYLFSLNLPAFSVSWRLGIFMAVFFAGCWQMYKQKNIEFIHSRFFAPYLLFLSFIVLGVINGFMRGYDIKQIFWDFNNFFFLGFAWPLWQAFKTKSDIYLMFKVSLAAIVTGIFKVLFILYVFSHHLQWAMPPLYKWVRDTRVGEITKFTEYFYRVFFQSQFFHLVAWFFVYFLLLDSALKKSKRLFVLFSFLSASLLLSLSRSLWLGLCLALLVFTLVSAVYANQDWRGWWYQQIKGLGLVILSFIGAILILLAVIKFPIPLAKGTLSAGLFSDRLATADAASISRWALLPPLWQAVSENWLWGAGFGKAVTYQSSDPRIVAQFPDGLYTTTTFEWGYLDLWLKLGLLGLLSYIIWLCQALYYNFRYLKSADTWWIKGALSSALALGVIHFFTPYLNHPLGLGFILLWMLSIQRLTKGENQPKLPL